MAYVLSRARHSPPACNTREQMPGNSEASPAQWCVQLAPASPVVPAALLFPSAAPGAGEAG